MNIYEYQAKKLFADYSISVPIGYAAFSPEEAKQVVIQFIKFYS